MGGLCQNFGKESRFLVSGPGIGVMSEQRGVHFDFGKFRGGSCHFLIVFSSSLGAFGVWVEDSNLGALRIWDIG
ncbi:hypothetical protein Prudu_002378 [Prunus dulcis]|uniref:Uncharacterized protein n=1 Tax=Prunus dulcis TaxID=3755 RepID=A0A4Y1QQP9_PRUDU|nr:hypothetical protein Prudu_002378 [Prunus dulcis]